MNRKTIQKVIDELSKDTPRLDYVRGILETLIESLPEETAPIITGTSKVNIPIQAVEVQNKTIIDESKMMENSAMAILNKVDLTKIQTE